MTRHPTRRRSAPYRIAGIRSGGYVLAITSGALLTACSLDSQGDAGSASTPIDNTTTHWKADGGTGNHAAATEGAGDEMVPATAPEVELFSMPESTLLTECAAADQYPDRQVQPVFYAYPSPPEHARYIQCVFDEAQRDGGRKRVASPLSFPKIGACYDARITGVSNRFGGKPSRDAGTSVSLDNRLNLVDYTYVPEAARSRIGDKVEACVHDLPKDCPADDLRGIGYRITNLRTRQSWVMGDRQHMCRGA